VGGAADEQRRAAHLVHDRGVRREGPFLVSECAGLPAVLLESELFGHQAGAFAGAYRARSGLLLLVNRGTLVLRDAHTIPRALWARLLRFARTAGEIVPLGAERAVGRADVRLMAATSSDAFASGAGWPRAFRIVRLA
jgi:transcriptional regulator with GAF, ATPase, and Fis domain